MTTTFDILKFIIRHRKNKAFRDTSYRKIVEMINNGIKNASIVVVNDKDGEIVGVCIGHNYNLGKVFFVQNILTIRTGVLKTCLSKFHALWPDYEIVADRHGRRVSYNTTKLLNKFHII